MNSDIEKIEYLAKLYSNLYKIVFFPFIVMNKLCHGEYSLNKTVFWFLVCGQFQLIFFALIWGWPLLLLDKKDAVMVVPVYYACATIGVWRSADKSSSPTGIKILYKIIALLIMCVVGWRYHVLK